MLACTVQTHRCAGRNATTGMPIQRRSSYGIVSIPDTLSTSVDIEVTPFVDTGRVFADSGTFPISHLHTVGEVGFRGIARPFVVGYVDVGYGSEGAAVFTGINYPF
jgi:hypothetical protein